MCITSMDLAEAVVVKKMICSLMLQIDSSQLALCARCVVLQNETKELNLKCYLIKVIISVPATSSIITPFRFEATDLLVDKVHHKLVFTFQYVGLDHNNFYAIPVFTIQLP